MRLLLWMMLKAIPALNYGASTMRGKVVGLVAAAALLASAGTARAKDP
jgi:hypothetical protein